MTAEFLQLRDTLGGCAVQAQARCHEHGSSWRVLGKGCSDRARPPVAARRMGVMVAHQVGGVNLWLVPRIDRSVPASCRAAKCDGGTPYAGRAGQKSSGRPLRTVR